MTQLDLSTLVLKTGNHNSRAEGLCAMEAVAWLANEPHSDKPECTCPVLAAFVRTLNDNMPDAERQKLVAYLPRLIGTQVDTAKKIARAELLAWAAVRKFAPLALRAAGLKDQADTLANFEGSLSDVSDASDASDASYVASAAASAASNAASAAARHAARYARYAASAAAAAASAASYAASYAASAAAGAASAANASEVWAVVFPILDAVLEIK